MSSEELTTRKKRTSISETAKRTPEDDHRRKRRNRTTQSCLNCHTSKRMCDRKRPCGRCTQLGLTGLCVYEVDDPSQRADTSDEKTRLQKRVAELESVIRELKNKPHPRWTRGSGNNDSLSKSSRSGSEELDPSSSSPPRVLLHPPTPAPSSRPSPMLTASTSSSCRPSPLLIACSSSAGSSVIGTPSPTDTPSPLALTPVEMTSDGHGTYDLASLLSTCYPDGNGMDTGSIDALFDGLIHHEGLCSLRHEHGHCGCLTDVVSYNVVLELSLRLRRAAEILGRDTKHRSSVNCPIHQRIAELDRHTTEALANINTYPAVHPQPHHGFSSSSAGRVSSSSNSVSPQSLHPSMRPWDFKAPASYPSPPCEDSFMSWDPSRRPADWS